MREPTEMELRVAEALWLRYLRHTRDPSGVHTSFTSALGAHPWMKQFIEDARAAIRAMREPTPFMRTNAVMYVNDNEPAVSKAAVVTKHMTAIWHAMIDAASPPDSGEG